MTYQINDAFVETCMYVSLYMWEGWGLGGWMGVAGGVGVASNWLTLSGQARVLALRAQVYSKMSEIGRAHV